MSVTHSKVSAVADGADTSLVRPSDWNDDHVVALDAGDIPTHSHAGADITSGTVADARIASTIARDSELAAHVDDTADAHDASAVSFIPSGPIVATDVQEAIVGALNAAVLDGDIAAGQLSGTYPNPSVAASHSGSTHAATQAAAEATAASELTTHAAASDPHTVYVREADANWIDLTDSGATTLHSHAGGGAPTDADYLVGTANGSLSAEIVVGTSPGGELGGTWASPTVDATHAGSVHMADHTHAVTGQGATGGGGALAPTDLLLPTGAPNAEGEIGWDATNDLQQTYDGVRAIGTSSRGWAAVCYPVSGFVATAAHTTALALAANGGSLAVPIWVPSHFLLHDVAVRNTDAATARTWGWDLYIDRLNNSNTADRVAASNGDESFTPGAASTRLLGAASAPVYLAPGVYWLVIQSTHATSSFGVGTTAVAAGSVAGSNVSGQTKTTTNPNNSTLDLVAATWTKQTASISVALRGRVLGMAAPI